jgi:hypothetical protein
MTDRNGKKVITSLRFGFDYASFDELGILHESGKRVIEVILPLLSRKGGRFVSAFRWAMRTARRSTMERPHASEAGSSKGLRAWVALASWWPEGSSIEEPHHQ